MLIDPPVSDDPARHSLPFPEEKLLSRIEAARYLGLPVNTVYQWARTGRLPYKVTLGGHLRFARADLDVARARHVRPRPTAAQPREP
jgi:excisionase family DNA binding protein